MPAAVRDAEVSVPGDKSISHRALMLGGIANGTTHVRGFLDGEDCLATMAAMQAMGVRVERHGATEVSVHGVGLHGLEAPEHDLDLGNSGTGMRLMAGLLAPQPFSTTLTGDASLQSRPMGRVTAPLEQMGAKIDSNDGRPPLHIHGGRSLKGIEYALPVASAQVKSAMLLAGLYADGETRVTEPAVTRDHTERMLRTMGVAVSTVGPLIRIEGGQSLHAGDIEVPGDLSSATFIILAALLSTDADVLVKKVGINPTRTGVLEILRAMGAELAVENERRLGDEPVADIRVQASELHGIDVDPALVSLAIDEFPALFVAAAVAKGQTTFSGLQELRVKESDRIACMAKGLAALGIELQETADGAVITGGRFSGGVADSFGDHRVAMSLAVAATIADGQTQINNVGPVETSFPGFDGLMNSIGAKIDVREEVQL